MVGLPGVYAFQTFPAKESESATLGTECSFYYSTYLLVWDQLPTISAEFGTRIQLIIRLDPEMVQESVSEMIRKVNF